MRFFGLSVCFMVMLTSMHFISSSSLPDKNFPVYESSAAALTHNRKLMEKNNKDIGNVNLEDYQSVDPPPSSTSPNAPAPIPHGTPLMPHMEDYQLVDPPPSSTSPNAPVPIPHGTPLMPHIPKRGPPTK